jgi:hypothetical protein
MPTADIADLAASQVLEAIVAGAARRVIDLGPGDLRALEITFEAQRVYVVSSDDARNRGSIGSQEADQIVAALALAGKDGAPLVFLLETSGIRVTDGTAGIASLRRLLRAAEDARLGGTRLLAMVTKSAFGGASILASVCERRIVHAGSVFSMSGPKLIEQSAGVDRFRAGDGVAVRSLLGGEARARASSSFIVVQPDAEAYKMALVDWLRSPAPASLTLERLRQHTAWLSERLTAALPDPVDVAVDEGAPDDETARILADMLPSGFRMQRVENVLIVQGFGPSAPRVLVLSCPEGAGARDTLALARALVDAMPLCEGAGRCVLLVDAESHKATPEDEQVVLSEVLANLALVIRALHRLGTRVEVIVTGRGGGGIQGALGSGATSVTMGPRSRLSVLPQSAMRALNKSEDADAGTIATALKVGAIDGAYVQTTTTSLV